MGTRAAVAAVSAVAAAFAPAAAHAAAPWSAPQTLSTAHEFVDPVDVAFAPDGSGLAAWTFQDGTDAHGTTGASLAPRPAASAAFGAQRSLIARRQTDRATTLAGVAAFGAGRTLAVTVQRRRVNPLRPDAFALRAVSGTTAGRIAGRRTIAVGPQILRATPAADARGDAAVAWWERGTRSRLFVAVRRHGHAFGRPQQLAAGGFGDVAVAVGPSGQVLVTWESRGVVRARTARRARFGAATVVARAARGADLVAGLSRAGRVVIAWGAQHLSSGGEAGPLTFRTAIRRPGGAHFAVSLREREPGSVLYLAPVALTVEPDGRATFAWTSGANRLVRVSTARANAPFAPAQDISAPGAALGGLAAAGGRRALTWVAGTPDDGGAIQAAVAGPGERLFGAPELVAAGPRARVPRVAIDPRSHRATVVWSERPAPAPGAARTIARAATRSPG